MTRYLLDTGPLAALLLGRPGANRLLRPWPARHQVVTSILVYGEVIEYLENLRSTDVHIQKLRDLVLEVRPQTISSTDAERYATIRRMLRPPHGPGLIGDIDTLIAATALERNLTVVTTDTDFTRVPDLQVMLLAPRTFVPVTKMS